MRLSSWPESQSVHVELPADLQHTDATLEIDPEAAGKPLLGRLKGLWSARVGSYRIIYSIEGSGRSPKVTVRAIKHRAQAYQQRRHR